MPAGFTDLDYAVYTALGPPRPFDSLEDDPGVSNALRRLNDRLVEDGLLLSPGQRGAARSASLVMFAVMVLGIARTIAGAANHKSVGYLVFSTIVVFVIATRLVAVPKVSRAGRKVLAQLRSSYAYLRPSQAPSWATYGAMGAMFGVALYGTSALWAADPAFAAHAGLARASMGSSGWSSSGDSGSWSSGDSG